MDGLPMRLVMPSWWFTGFCALVACTCLALSYWQHRRAHLKQTLQDRADERIDGAPLRNADLAGRTRDTLTWHPAELVGTYDRDGQFLVDNRVHNHRAGFHVVTPLALADGTWVLVNRGWLPVPARRDEVAAPAAPGGTVTISGLLAPDDTGAFELAEDTGAGGIWQWLIVERWTAATGRTAVPAVLLAARDAPGLVPVADAPDYRAGISRGYRLQWLAFAMITTGGWLAMALRRTAT